MRISDWSSDVCSSDLIHQDESTLDHDETNGRCRRGEPAIPSACAQWFSCNTSAPSYLSAVVVVAVGPFRCYHAFTDGVVPGVVRPFEGKACSATMRIMAALAPDILGRTCLPPVHPVARTVGDGKSTR